MLLLLVVSLGGAFYASLAWYGFDLLEEGYFLTHARRVQAGGLPYRDFSTPYTPGVFYLYAWMMDWIGPTWSPCASSPSWPGGDVPRALPLRQAPDVPGVRRSPRWCWW